MTVPAAVVRWSTDESNKTLCPTTLDKLGKNKEFLETVIAAEPDLLGLQTRRSGIRGPFCVFRQLPLPTPTGRTIYPDIVILAASGHVVVVEVKLRANPELLNRSVIAQIIDYAASFVALDEAQVMNLFLPPNTHSTWADYISEQFPDETSADELADMLRSRMRAGEINLIIACDSVPAGLLEVVAGITSQSTLGFDLDLVEITPFCADNDRHGEILFVLARRLATEIVARTCVTVSYREGDQQPSTLVETTTIEEIEQNIRSAATTSQARVWSAAEVKEAFEELGDPTRLTLMEFARQHSYEGKWVSPQPKQSATFGFSLPYLVDDRVRTRMAFYCVLSWKHVTLCLEGIRQYAPPELSAEFNSRLKSVFEDLDTEGKEPGILWSQMGLHIDEFMELVLWLKQRLEVCLECPD